MVFIFLLKNVGIIRQNKEFKKMKVNKILMKSLEMFYFA